MLKMANQIIYSFLELISGKLFLIDFLGKFQLLDLIVENLLA